MFLSKPEISTGHPSTTTTTELHMSLLGHTYTDRITGFTGIAVGHCKYLTGCNQTLLSPRGIDPSKRPESEWFDDQRLALSDAAPFSLDNGNTPGPDKPAPRI